MWRILLMILVGLLIAVPGCGVQRCRIHGVVKYQGKPLSGATVTFFGQDNMTYLATTKPDGTYEVAGVPAGKIGVTVQVSAAPRSRPRPPPGSSDTDKPDDPAPPPQPRPAILLLPPKYGDPKTSGLSLDLKEPAQEFTIDLQ